MSQIWAVDLPCLQICGFAYLRQCCVSLLLDQDAYCVHQRPKPDRNNTDKAVRQVMQIRT